MPIDKLQEVTRKKIPAHDHIETRLSWCNSYLAVNIEHGIYLMKLSQNVESFSKKIEFIDYLLETPKKSPISALFQSKKQINNLNLTEMYMEPAFWPHNKELASQMTYYSNFGWSPKQFTYNHISLLAALTNTGCIEMYGSEGRAWSNLLNLTEILFANPDYKKKPNNFDDLYSLVRELKTTAICWGDTMKQHEQLNIFYFVTGQGNGDILFWTIDKTKTSLEANLILKYNASNSEIIALHWLQLTSDTVLLIYTNVSGEIFSINCSLNKNQVEVNRAQTLWKYKDRITVKHIVCTKVNGQQVIVFTKLRHILAMLINNSGYPVISECTINPTDERIVSLCNTKDNIYFITEYCNLYKLTLSIVNSQMNLAFSQIIITDVERCSIHGMAISENSALLAIAICNDNNNTEKAAAQFINFRYYIAHDVNEIFDIIINNRIQRFYDVDDCFEVLRYLVLKNNVLPALDYDRFYVGAKDNIYKLRVFLKLLKIFALVEPYLYKNSLHKAMPVAVENVQELLLLKQAQMRLTIIDDSHEKNNKLNIFELESLSFVTDFLSYYSEKYNCNINELSNVNYEVIKFKQPSILCQCCGNKYDGRWFGSDHFNMFCCLSFTPINSNEYLFCPNCNSTARVEMLPSEPVCVFCDSHLIKQ